MRKSFSYPPSIYHFGTMTPHPPDILDLPFPAELLQFRIAADRTFTLAAPADPDQVLDSIGDEEYEKDRFLPYWAEQWPSARPLLDYLLQQSVPDDWYIGELGCGLGFVTAILTSCRPNVMVATDISPEGCRFAACNCTMNAGRSHIVCSDWRNLPFKSRFDAIVASDVLYEERWIEPVIHGIRLLVKPGGIAWFSDPCRRFWPQFKNRLADYGLRHEVRSRTVVNDEGLAVEILEISGFTDG